MQLNRIVQDVGVCWNLQWTTYVYFLPTWLPQARLQSSQYCLQCLNINDFLDTCEKCVNLFWNDFSEPVADDGLRADQTVVPETWWTMGRSRLLGYTSLSVLPSDAALPVYMETAKGTCMLGIVLTKKSARFCEIRNNAMVGKHLSQYWARKSLVYCC